MSRGRAFAFVLAVALSGCAMVGPDYKRPETSLPPEYGEPAKGGPASLVVPAQWWMLYGDPMLDELVASGLERNADVRVAVARVEEAEALVREAYATRTFPLVTGQGGVSRGHSVLSGTTNTFTLTAGTTFELDLWGRLRRAELATREALLATQYARDTVSLSLAASIARTYFALRSLDSQLAASEEIVRLAGESLALGRKRSAAGVGSDIEVYQAGSLRTAAAAQAKEIERQRAVVQHQLGVLSGRLDVRVEPQPITPLPVPPLPPPGLPSELLERRPDVRQAEANLASATQRIGVARAAQFPTVSLTGMFGVSSLDLGEMFNSSSRVWSIGGSILGPIIDAGRYAARTEQAEAQARQAEGVYQRAVENAFRDVNDALSNVRLAAEAETELAARVSDARNGLRLAQMRYESGYSAYLEVLDAQRTLNEAQLAFIRNRQAYLSFTVDLMNALGGGWQAG